MKFTKIDVPNPSIQQVKLNGEMITIIIPTLKG